MINIKEYLNQILVIYNIVSYRGPVSNLLSATSAPVEGDLRDTHNAS